MNDVGDVDDVYDNDVCVLNVVCVSLMMESCCVWVWRKWSGGNGSCDEEECWCEEDDEDEDDEVGGRYDDDVGCERGFVVVVVNVIVIVVVYVDYYYSCCIVGDFWCYCVCVYFDWCFVFFCRRRGDFRRALVFFRGVMKCDDFSVCVGDVVKRIRGVLYVWWWCVWCELKCCNCFCGG